MNASYLPAVAALVGSAIGGLTSLATTWLTLRDEAKSKQRIQDRVDRETLFAQFVDEASRLFADAFTRQCTEVTQLAKLYSLVSRLRLIASENVVLHAEVVTDKIIETYLAPNKNFQDLPKLKEARALEPLKEFSEAGRAELRRLGAR